MPGPAPKPVNRQRSHQGEARPVVVSIAARSRLSPDAPDGLLAASRAAWGRLWTNPVAATFVESDVAALGRLFTLRDERDRAFRTVRRAGRVVEGSKGQPVLSPLLGYVASLDAEIRALEDRFGLTPRARLTLGITLGEAHRSLADLNAEFLEADHGDE